MSKWASDERIVRCYNNQQLTKTVFNNNSFQRIKGINMDKHILYTVLESLTAGMSATINFHEPFVALSGDYTIVASKVGRGRGGSRVIEIAPVSNPTDSFAALEIDGREKALGTGTSEYINTIIVDGKTYGMEDALETRRTPTRAKRPSGETVVVPRSKTERTPRTAASTAQSERVANVMGEILTENPATNFKIIAKDRNSTMNGEWRVDSFNYADNALSMKLISIDDATQMFEFDSNMHGADIRDIQVIGIENM